MNRILYAEDCLNVLKDEVALPTGSVDLIYLDPPFNSKSDYNLPFKGNYKNLRPVEAFKDTWTWSEKEEEHLEWLDSGSATKTLANIIRLSQEIAQKSGGGRSTVSTPAYLINMAVRLVPMRRVLKNTGSLYLHCDPTANYYLRLILDAIFGANNFRNEVIWHYYNGTSNIKRAYVRKHDVILFYSRDHRYLNYNEDYAREPYVPDSNFVKNPKAYKDKYKPNPKGKRMHDVWRIPTINNMANERLGYPTQKPLPLLKRIIQASSNQGDLILDPFCGCGTTIHAAENLNRKWIGIDISTFSVGLMKERILNNFPNIKSRDIETHGTPCDLISARNLAKKDPFEFEKWVCGAIGAQGMYHNPGDRGSDGGVDGVINFALFKGFGEKAEHHQAIVQVKGGKVTADNVRALTHSVDEFNATAGIFVCFNKYMNTVENNRKKATYSDMTGTYPVIQGFSVERLLNDEKPYLPPLVQRQDARIKSDLLQ